MRDDRRANAEHHDVVERRGGGRRWSLIGPFETMALGGPDTFVKIAPLLFAEVGREVDPESLARIDLPPAEA